MLPIHCFNSTLISILKGYTCALDQTIRMQESESQTAVHGSHEGDEHKKSEDARAYLSILGVFWKRVCMED